MTDTPETKDTSAKENSAGQDSAKIKQGIIEALLEEDITPGAANVVVNFMRRQLQKAGESMTKADVLAVADDGTHFLQEKRGWDVFGILNQLVRESGESFTADDFRAPLGTSHGGQKPLHQWAAETGSLSKIFTYEVWQDNEDEMLEFFYEMPEDAQKQVDLVSVRREFARARGEDIREDRLARLDLSLEKIALSALNARRFKEVSEQLKDAGEQLLADDLHTPKADGSTVFEDSSLYFNLPEIVETLNDHGQTLSKEDFTMVSGHKSAIEYAGEQNLLGRIFDENIWVGRAEEMLELYAELPERFKSQVDITAVLSKVDDKTFAEHVSINENTPLHYLYTTVRGAQPVVGQADRSGLKPLGTKKGWDDLNSAYTRLKEKGVSITLDSLRDDNGRGDASMLYVGIASGHFELVQMIAEDSGDQLTLEDLTQETAFGDTLLNQLATRHELVSLLKPENWVNRVDEMKAVIDAVPDDKRGTIDFDKFLFEARDKTYGAQLSVDSTLTKQTLLEAIDTDGSRMLGFPSVWENIEDIRAALSAKGEDLTIEDLRLTAGPDNSSLLLTAVQNGKFDTVMDIVSKSSSRLTMADVTAKNAKNESVLDILVREEKLSSLFKPAMWIGRVQEMQELWQQVPDHARRQVNYQSVLTAVDRETLKAKSPMFKVKPPSAA